ncbi:MFS transporter [Streptomyces orinoci]|uniref:MFS transporter n=1 Tax=Streptomyces orinoci TaxID=67339 RepID=A0ABV3JRC5_STRON|nr:MFS transporter [Streptomyces orinoci]
MKPAVRPRPDTTGLPGTRRPLAGLLAATAVSLTATRVSAIALPWFVLVTTGIATRTGLVAPCELAPYVLVKTLSGPLLDRTGARTVSWTMDALSAGAAVLIPLSQALGLLRFRLLLALVVLIGAARGPGDLAKDAMVPEAAGRGRIQLERATGFTGVVEQSAATVGPALGGALVALAGPMTALYANAACFALGSLIVILALPRGMGRATAPSRNRTGYARQLSEGLRFLRGEPLLLTIACVAGFTNLLNAAFQQVLLTVRAQRSGHGPTVIGIDNAAFGAAAVGGGTVAAALAHRLRRRPVFFTGYLLSGPLMYLGLTTGGPPWLVALFFAVAGLGAGFLNPILGAISYERVPRLMLGRVRALSSGIAWAGIPFGGLLAGGTLAAIGLTPALPAGGAVYLLATTPAGLRPEWREM